MLGEILGESHVTYYQELLAGVSILDRELGTTRSSHNLKSVYWSVNRLHKVPKGPI